MNASDIDRIAAELLDAQDHGHTIASIAARHPGFDWGAAYAVAAQLDSRRRARGARAIGRKIGFTNRNIWAEYGATAPIWAHVYDETVLFADGNRVELSLAGSVAPRIEPEIAFKLRAPVPANLRDPVEVLQSVEWYAPSFEIVDCHFADWKFRPADSAADFSFHWRLVLGQPAAIGSDDDLDLLAQRLRDCRVTLSCDGREMDHGVGANALDHPALALAHLADVLSAQPMMEPLAAGEIITTGTLTAAFPIKPGETWTSRREGLPVDDLTVAFTE
jgi:2-oxo-3-hexenedioate decarboxylase